MTITEFFVKNPDVLDDEKKLKATFADYYNGNEAKVRIMMNAYNMGIISAINDNKRSEFDKKNQISMLISQWGMQESKATDAINEWHRICTQEVLNSYMAYLEEKRSIVKSHYIIEKFTDEIIEYDYEALDILKDIMSSPEIDVGEKVALVEAFSGCIEEKFHMNEYQHSAMLIYGTSMKYIDSEISSYTENKNITEEACNRAANLCQRQYYLIGIFANNKWKAPKIKNVRPERLEKYFVEKKEELAICNRIIWEDHTVTELLLKANKELTLQSCESASQAINSFEIDLKVCQDKGLSLPDLENSDIAMVRRKLRHIENKVKRAECLKKEIAANDSKITELLSMNEVPFELYDELINLCNQSVSDLSEYRSYGFVVEKLRNSSLEDISAQYTKYLEMKKLDEEISVCKNDVSSEEKYDAFLEKCSRQQSNINQCKKNGWKNPSLNNTNPEKIASDACKQKQKEKRKKLLKRKLIMYAVLATCIAICALYIRQKLLEGKASVPFDSSYVQGQEVDEVVNELELAGFENITKVSSEKGWMDENKVLSVAVDKMDQYRRGTYVDPNVKVEVLYSSAGRKYVTELLKNWKNTNHDVIKKNLQEAGFTNIAEEDVLTSDKSKDKKVAALSLNEEIYTNQRCYLPLDAPIVITYHNLKISIGNDNAQMKGQNYKDVVLNLEGIGFTNVTTQEIKTGWAKGNTVIGVTVNNTEEYDSSAIFKPDAKIVVKYSSDDRIDATQILENWQEKDWKIVQEALINQGFKDVDIESISTQNVEENNKIKSVTIGKELFKAGDCYVQKSTPMKIEYYELLITIGNESSYYKGKNYSDIVAELRKLGFTNIKLVRSDDLKNGFLNKEGEIRNITIGDKRKFKAEDTFKYDDTIEIVVNTYKNKGCEDIK